MADRIRRGRTAFASVIDPWRTTSSGGTVSAVTPAGSSARAGGAARHNIDIDLSGFPRRYIYTVTRYRIDDRRSLHRARVASFPGPRASKSLGGLGTRLGPG